MGLRPCVHFRASPASRKYRTLAAILGEHLLNDCPGDVGQSEITSHVPVSQLCMIDAEAVKYGCLQVVDVNGVLHNLEAEIIGLSDGRSRLDAPSRQPH